ncbi:MAG: hypothetical protein FWG08_01045 [Propionibacteriaceae bacterium]|nr:hypothetical protein [Propionibacteriaceae bacterium]
MTFLASVLRRVLLHRRLLASLSAGICVLALCLIFTQDQGPTTQVYVTTSRIPSGTIVSDNQVHLVQVPRSLVPLGAISTTEDLSDQMTSAPIAQGAILTSDNFVASSQATPGHVIIPLSVSSQVLTLLQPGDRVSVFQSHSSTSDVTITRGIRVVTIPSSSSSGLFSDSADVILVEVPERLATQITSSGGMGTTTIAIE